MRAQCVLVLFLGCVASFTSASLSRRVLHHRRGTVAESRAHQTPYRAAPAQEPKYEAPDIGFTGNKPPPAIQDQSPESYQNVANYKMDFPTPRPAALNGVYCRGGTCQYRIDPGPPTYPPPMTPPPLPIGGDALAGREFCRGLTCLKGMGAPVMPGLAPFTLNCVHLFNDVGGGMSGDDTNRKVAQVYDSFEKVCQKRVTPLEVASCPAYANTFIGAVAAKVNQPTVGGPVEVCQDTFHWIQMFKQAEVDLRLTAAALPKGKSLLAADLNRFGTGGVGPSSPRGLKWRAYVSKSGKWPQPPAVPQQLADDGSFAVDGSFADGSFAGFLQTDSSSKPPAPKPKLLGADTDEDTPRGLPKYVQNTLPRDGKAKPPLPMSQTKYQVAPGSPDGAVPPIEVAGDLFDYCSNQFSEIMVGFSQTARVTVQMTMDWCRWQGGVSSWVGKKEEFGHPDWSHRTCSGMENLVAFALRDQLADTTSGLSAQQVCKNIFLTISTVHKTEGLVKGAWEQSLRTPSSGIPAADDADMQVMLKDAQQYANEVFQKLRRQKLEFQKLNGIKMDMGAWNGKVMINPPHIPEPDLPSTDDFDVAMLLSLSVEHVRASRRIGISVADKLKPWGYSI